jgi:4-hydroxy-tetrahydrodipicolinate synthase
MSKFTKAKEIFSEEDRFDYISLDRSTYAYNKIIQSMKKPLKLILFFGKPGTGKSYLLRKIEKDFKNSKKRVLLYLSPFFEEITFLRTLFFDLFGVNAPKEYNYDELLKILYHNFDKQKFEPVVVLIDEAQLYPDIIIDKIRLLADSRRFKFLFTVHKTGKEDIIAKEYFQTRIWESIELSSCSYEELKTYIEKKLLYHEQFSLVQIFNNKIYKKIYKYSRGNLRDTNKLLYKMFEIMEYYDANEPSKIDLNNIGTKFVEMAALETRLLNA